MLWVRVGPFTALRLSRRGLAAIFGPCALATLFRRDSNAAGISDGAL